MDGLDFLEIARLVNHSRTTYIQLSPSIGQEGRWGIYQGKHKIHASEYPFDVLYFNAAATNEDIQKAAKEIIGYENVHVVYPPSLVSLARRHSELPKLFQQTTGLWSTKEYLRSFIKEELQVYLDKIKVQKPEFYIDPIVETPSGFDRKIPNPILSFLNTSNDESGVGIGKLGILLAEPGQGKTYMSRYLVAKIAQGEAGYVPLMVNSSQWQMMPVEEQSSLSKTILNSFRSFEANIGWLEGLEEQFLNTSLKADLFRIVFDGFDEFILRNRGNVQPLDVLEAITNLAVESGTPIIITSRTSFWNTNLPEIELAKFIERTGSLTFIIKPFDVEHAKKYFTSRLQVPRKIDGATQIYSLLRQENKAFIGRGFVLSLVADLADKRVDVKVENEITNSLLWLVHALSEREIVRQQLPFSLSEQIEILQMFAIEMALGSEPTTELLSVIIETIEPNLGGIEILDKTVEKLKSHPLIEREQSEDLWRFKQEQIKILLIADQLMKWSDREVGSFINKVSFDPGMRQDIGAMIVDLIFGQYQQEGEKLGRIRKITKSLSPSYTLNQLNFNSEGRRLAAVVSLMSVERFLPRGTSHIERTSQLQKVLGEKSIRGLSFTSAIARFDFRGINFENCSFESVPWANCKFDKKTKFQDCYLYGGIPPQFCEGFGEIELQNCKLNQEAEAIINNARIKEGNREYSTDDLKNDIKCVVNKFFMKDGFTLKTVDERDLANGPISTSRYKREVLETLHKIVIEQDTSIEKSGRYKISPAALESVRFYSGNNVFTGGLKDAFETLRRKLSLELR